MYLQQKGMGLIEVMVALLLLAIAVLGFSALQMQAVQSTDESLLRSQATNTISGFTEAMRENIDYLSQMKKILNNEESFSKNCLSSSVTCNKEEIAKYTANKLRLQATNEGYKIRMITCPGTASGTPINCIILAWKDTEATKGSDSTDCIKDSGAYNKGASCLLMEAY